MRRGAQGLGGAGTLQGTVKDPTGGVMVAVGVDLSNPVSGFKRTATTDAAGKFIFHNLPPNQLSPRGRRAGIPDAERGRRRAERRADRRSTLTLQLAGGRHDGEGRRAHSRRPVERDPTAHTDIDQSLIAKLPSSRPPA